MRNFLLLGGTGLLGNNWLFFRHKKENYYSNVNRTKFKKSNLKFNKIKINLNKTKEIIDFINKKKISVLINLIAITDVEYCEKNKAEAYDVNVKLVHNIAKACKNTKTTLIHISTDQLFNGKKKIFYENSKISPLNNYGLTKYKAEKIVKKLCKKHIILRTNFFCWGLKNNKNFLSEIFNSISNKKNFYGWSNVFFTPIYSGILVDIAHNLESRRKYGLFNVSSNTSISKYRFASIITKNFSLNKRYLKKSLLDVKNYTRRPLNMSLSNFKIKKIIPHIKTKLDLNYQINKLKKDRKKFLEIFKNV